MEKVIKTNFIGNLVVGNTTVEAIRITSNALNENHQNRTFQLFQKISKKIRKKIKK